MVCGTSILCTLRLQIRSTEQDGSSRISDILVSLLYGERKWRHGVHLFYSLCCANQDDYLTVLTHNPLQMRTGCRQVIEDAITSPNNYQKDHLSDSNECFTQRGQNSRHCHDETVYVNTKRGKLGCKVASSAEVIITL